MRVDAITTQMRDDFAADASSGPARASTAVQATSPSILGKRFATARAQAALAGVALMRTDPTDGPVIYLAQRADRVRVLHTVDDLEAVLVGAASSHA